MGAEKRLEASQFRIRTISYGDSIELFNNLRYGYYTSLVKIKMTGKLKLST